MNLTAMPTEEIAELISNAHNEILQREITKHEADTKKFFVSKQASKLAAKVAKLSADYKVLSRRTSKVKIEVEFTITLNANHNDLFTECCGNSWIEDLFSVAYKAKLVNPNSFTSEAVNALENSIDRVLNGACIGGLDMDEKLKKEAEDFLNKANLVGKEILDHYYDFTDVQKKSEDLFKKANLGKEIECNFIDVLKKLKKLAKKDKK